MSYPVAWNGSCGKRCLAVGDCAGELGYVPLDVGRWGGRWDGRGEEWGHFEDDAVCTYHQ